MTTLCQTSLSPYNLVIVPEKSVPYDLVSDKYAPDNSLRDNSFADNYSSSDPDKVGQYSPVPDNSALKDDNSVTDKSFA